MHVMPVILQSSREPVAPSPSPVRCGRGPRRRSDPRSIPVGRREQAPHVRPDDPRPGLLPARIRSACRRDVPQPEHPATVITNVIAETVTSRPFSANAVLTSDLIRLACPTARNGRSGSAMFSSRAIADRRWAALAESPGSETRIPEASRSLPAPGRLSRHFGVGGDALRC
jgi:hypothetical protein